MGLMQLVATSFHTLTFKEFAWLPKVSISHLQPPSPTQTNHDRRNWVEGKGNKWNPRAAREYMC